MLWRYYFSDFILKRRQINCRQMRQQIPQNATRQQWQLANFSAAHTLANVNKSGVIVVAAKAIVGGQLAADATLAGDLSNYCDNGGDVLGGSGEVWHSNGMPQDTHTCRLSCEASGRANWKFFHILWKLLCAFVKQSKPAGKSKCLYCCYCCCCCIFDQETRTTHMEEDSTVGILDSDWTKLLSN